VGRPKEEVATLLTALLDTTCAKSPTVQGVEVEIPPPAGEGQVVLQLSPVKQKTDADRAPVVEALVKIDLEAEAVDVATKDEALTWADH